MKPFLLLSLLIVAAYGVKHSLVDYGKTTASDLVAEKGEPLEKKPTPEKNTEIYQYPQNEKFQIKNDVVTHGFKDPDGDERTLIYWKHKFRDCDPITKKISETKGHELAEYELKCPEQGLTVIYAEGSEFVSRIIEHAKN